MTIKDTINSLLAKQRSITEASRAAGHTNLTDDEQREFDAIQANLDLLNGVETGNEEAARAAAEAERQRVSEITAVCREFNFDSTEFINDPEATVDTARAAILASMKNNQLPHGVGVTKDEGDKFRAAAADGLALRAGISIESPAAGANELRNFSLKELAIESLAREGKDERKLRSMSPDDLMREFLNPTAAFPMICDSAINKGIAECWKTIPTTFEQFTSKGSLSDFKESRDHEYVLGSFGEFPVIPEGGELKADSIGATALPTRSLETRGKTFSLTREAFINDDIGFVAKLPQAFARADKMTIEMEVYRKLFNNPKIFDDKTLFHADHKNLIPTGAAPSVESIEAAILMGKNQVDPYGRPIYWAPKFIITATGYEFALKTIFNSTHLPGTSNNDINPLYNNGLIHIESPVLRQLAGANACPWFLSADPLMARGIQVDYLRGIEVPTIRRWETQGSLGIKWDVFHDWKVNVVDYRGVIKNPGAKIA